MTFTQKVKIKGICDVKKKWVKLQYDDCWGDEDRVYVPTENWKEMDKPWIGDTIVIEVRRS